MKLTYITKWISASRYVQVAGSVIGQVGEYYRLMRSQLSSSMLSRR